MLAKLKTWDDLQELDTQYSSFIFTRDMENRVPSNRIIEVEEWETQNNKFYWKCAGNWEMLTYDQLEELYKEELPEPKKKNHTKKIIGLLILATAIYIGVKR